MLKLTPFLLLLIILGSCSEEESRKEYYFPFSKTTEAKVFKYVLEGEDEAYLYCKVTTIPESSFIVTETYNSDLDLMDKFDEIVTDHGAELLGYTEYRSVNLGGVFTERMGIRTKVIQKDVYKWNSKFSYYWSVEFPPEHGGNTVTKTRTQSNLEIIKIRGKEYETATFNDEYRFKKEEEAKRRDKNKNTLYQKTYYAKGIGIVKMERMLPVTREKVNIELSEILSNEEFEALLKK